jgi:hypothetical protein
VNETLIEVDHLLPHGVHGIADLRRLPLYFA